MIFFVIFRSLLFFDDFYYSPKALLGVLTFPEELVAEARTPRFRGEGSQNRFSEPKVPQGSARFPYTFLRISLWEGSAGFREVPRGSAKVPRVPQGSLKISL